MNMKKLITTLALALIAASSTPVGAQTSLESDPGYLAIDKALDLKLVKPEVNINLPRFLLKDVLADLGSVGGTNDPFAGSGVTLSELIQELLRVCFHVCRRI